MASSSSSTTQTHQGRYDYEVFLSFRGKDTRNNFVSHLYDDLKKKQIQPFIDNNDLERGDEISPSLSKAIQESKISVIIFSENYASSTWCLEELTKILACKKVNGQIVIPVFYRVHPSTVRNQTGSFADAFAKHDEEVVSKEKVQNWKKGLEEAASISGWHSLVIGSEAELINKIVEDILKKLYRMPQSTLFEGFVGISSRIKKVESLLCMKSGKTCSVGLWGMGGIGKTTLARVVSGHIYTQFEGFQFLENIKEEIKRDGIDLLWHKLLSKLLGDEDHLGMGILGLGILGLGLTFREERFRRKKFLVVFDDVDDSVHRKLKGLLNRRDDLFGEGSKILITSRDKQVLVNLADKVYEVPRLNHNEAVELFSLNAFKEKYPTTNDQSIHIEQMERMVKYASGNPLALIILGCDLAGTSKEYWDSALSELEKFPKGEIMNVLRISYDILSPDEKNIFLDIAYFLRGRDKDYAIKMLQDDTDNGFVGILISRLINKSLITVSHNKTLEMHDLVHEMAKSIVCEESVNNPGMRRRLSNPKDIYDVLTKKKGTDAVEGICLDLSKAKKMHLESDAFEGMSCLKFLKFYKNFEEKVHLPRDGLRYLPEELRYFHWVAFPSKLFSSNFCGENLVELVLPNSKVERLWSGVQNLVNLKRIDLSGSKYLTEIPNLSKAKNIERINLNGCKSLVELPSSIQYLNKLEHLSAAFCENLRILPRRIDSKSLRELYLGGCPRVKNCARISSENLELLDLIGTANKELLRSIRKSKTLRYLFLVGSNITNFPKLSSGNLLALTLTGTAIEEVPPSIGFLTKLTRLDMSNNKKLSRLPTSICKLQSLFSFSLSDCPKLKLESFPEILEPMESLEFLTLSNCKNLEFNSEFFRLLSSMTTSLVFLDLSGNNFESLPENIVQLDQLKDLILNNCKRILSLPKLPKSLYYLSANDCESLETISIQWQPRIVHRLELKNCLKLDRKARAEITSLSISDEVILPGSEIPEWYSYQSMGSSLTMLNHQLPLKQEVVGVSFCAVVALRKPSRSCNLSVTWDLRFIDNNGEHHGGPFATFGDICSLKPDHVVLTHSRDERLLGLLANNNNKKCSFDLDIVHYPVKVKKCGVHLHYGDKMDFSMDLFGGSMRDDANNNNTTSNLKRGRDDDFFSNDDIDAGPSSSSEKSDDDYPPPSPSNKRIKLLQA